MTDRPILMAAESVRGILDGRKTQTRRVIQPQPIYQGRECFGDSWKWKHGKDEFSGATTEQLSGSVGLLHPSRSAYGQLGDRLWVRETWCIVEQSSITNRDLICYRADIGNTYLDGRWKSAIHMPRWASRLTLDITKVRVERVQEISREDAIAEGMPEQSPMTRFAELWDSLNAKRGFGWEKNPWVWVIEFRRLHG